MVKLRRRRIKSIIRHSQLLSLNMYVHNIVSTVIDTISLFIVNALSFRFESLGSKSSFFPRPIDNDLLYLSMYLVFVKV